MHSYVDLCVNPAVQRLAILCEPGADRDSVKPSGLRGTKIFVLRDNDTFCRFQDFSSCKCVSFHRRQIDRFPHSHNQDHDHQRSWCARLPYRSFLSSSDRKRLIRVERFAVDLSSVQCLPAETNVKWVIPSSVHFVARCVIVTIGTGTSQNHVNDFTLTH